MPQGCQMEAQPDVPAAEAAAQERWAEHALTAEERESWARDGFLRVPNAVPAELLRRARAAVAEVLANKDDIHHEGGGKGSRRLNLHGLMGRDPAFLELVDLHSTFPKILGLMGFNIQLFHTQLVVTPPDPGGPSAERKKLSFHQVGRLCHPRRRLPADSFSLLRRTTTGCPAARALPTSPPPASPITPTR